MEQVRALLGDQVRLCHSLFEEYEPDRKFAAVVAANVLEHVEAPVALLRRARTWLQPGGAIHIVVPNGRSLHRRIGVHMGILSNLREFSDRDMLLGHRRLYTQEELLGDVRAAGLSPIRVEGIFLKLLSNAQLSSWDVTLLRALFEIGRELPDYCAEIYVECRPDHGAMC